MLCRGRNMRKYVKELSCMHRNLVKHLNDTCIYYITRYSKDLNTKYVYFDSYKDDFSYQILDAVDNLLTFTSTPLNFGCGYILLYMYYV